MRIALGVFVVAAVLSRPAHAGRDSYGWLYDTEVLPERGIELQTWIYEQNGKYGTRTNESWLWWGPVIGVTDQLELALPIELLWLSLDTGATSFTFKRFGAELRYRLAPPDPNEAPAFVPLVRFAAKRDVGVRDDLRLEADAVASYDAGPVQAVVNLGVVTDLTPHARHGELRPGGGFSVRATGELRVGAEVYAELSLDSFGESWAAAGPNLAWTHGRFWLSGSVGIGLYHVKVAPRLLWGIAF